MARVENDYSMSPESLSLTFGAYLIHDDSLVWIMWTRTSTGGTPCIAHLTIANFVSLDYIPETDERQHVPTLKCKILLPEFNTCEQVLLERKNRHDVPFCNAGGGFLAMFLCQNRQMPSAFRRKADAITA